MDMEVESKRRKLTEEVDPQLTRSNVNDTDLPLLSNFKDVKVQHYLMKMKFDFEKKSVIGSQILFLKPQNAESNPPVIILDTCSIVVKNVYSLLNYDKASTLTIYEKYKDSNNNSVKDFYKNQNWYTLPKESLKFTLDKWSLKIHLKSSGQFFPEVIFIEYETLPETDSLHWRPTSGYEYKSSSLTSKCVYTAASAINNRGLFPSQENPNSLSTWECLIMVEKDYTAFLSSENIEEEVLSEIETKYKTGYYFSSYFLPIATFSIVVGRFQNSFKLVPEIPEGEDPNPLVHSRLFSLVYIKDFYIKIARLSCFIKSFLISSNKLLGTLPFKRIDFVILPKCYPHLGLSSPHLIFLSPSLFETNETNTQENEFFLNSKIAHEISHYWFGLAIGALDWTEEWLSEGFATFMEDFLYKHAHLNTNLTPQTEEKIKLNLNVRTLLRFFTLKHEIENNQPELEQLIYDKDEANENKVKNGLVAIKQFLNVSYLKGLFFLRHLMGLVGENEFLKFMKFYVNKFNHHLVTSEIFMDSYIEYFLQNGQKDKNDPKFNKKTLLNDWLRNSKLPEPYNNIELSDSAKLSQLFPNCSNSIAKADAIIKQNGKMDGIELKTSTETILLLEKLLIEPHPETEAKEIEVIKNLKKLFDDKDIMENLCPDAIHSWCELILKYKNCNQMSDYKSSLLKTVSDFLLQHPSMGIYLFGELMISEDPTLQFLARHLYFMQLEIMDPSTIKVLKEMLF